MRCGVRWPMKSTYAKKVEAANCVVNCLRKTHRSVYDGMHVVMNCRHGPPPAVVSVCSKRILCVFDGQAYLTQHVRRHETRRNVVKDVQAVGQLLQFL